MRVLKSQVRSALDHLIYWREQHISERYFILLLALSIGVTMSILANALKYFIHHVEHFLMQSIELHSYLYPSIACSRDFINGSFRTPNTQR